MAAAISREQARGWVIFLTIAVLAGSLAFAAVRKTVSEDERRGVGTWCGLDTRDPDEPYAWIAERRADHTITIRFQNYRRIVSGDGTTTDEWVRSSSNVEVGRWWIEDGVYFTGTENAGARLGLLDSIGFWMDTGRWPPKEQFSERYALLKLDENNFDYQGHGPNYAAGKGPIYHSVRSADPVDFPALPLPPEQWVKPNGPAK